MKGVDIKQLNKTKVTTNFTRLFKVKFSYKAATYEVHPDEAGAKRGKLLLTHAVELI